MDPLHRLAPDDNVAVALRRIEIGERLRIDGIDLRARDEVPMAHKVALVEIPAGGTVTKFGVPIGIATTQIAPGQLVHVHNIKSAWINNALEHFEE